jgi:hypothetical protein
MFDAYQPAMKKRSLVRCAISSLLISLTLPFCTAAAKIAVAVLPADSEVILGEPLFVTLTVQNDTEKEIVFFPERPGGMEIRIWDSQRNEVNIPHVEHRNPDQAYWGLRVSPGETRAERLLISQIVNVPAPGTYYLDVSMPELGVGTITNRILIKSFDLQSMESWADRAENGIHEGPPGESSLWMQALSIISPTISEPHACRILKQDKAAAMPGAVDILRKANSAQAAACLSEALPLYDGVYRSYIERALTAITPQR